MPVTSTLPKALAPWLGGAAGASGAAAGRGASSRVPVTLLALGRAWALLLVCVWTNTCKYASQMWILCSLFGISILTKSELEKVIQRLLCCMMPGADWVRLI